MHVIKTGTLHYVMMAKRKCQTISFDSLHLHKEKDKNNNGNNSHSSRKHVKDKKAHKVIFTDMDS